MEQQQDKIIVEQVLRGDHQAFARLIRSTEALVATIIYKMIRSPADRKDIAQDVFIKVYNGLGTFRFQAKLSTWIGQITYNTCLKYLKKQKLVLWNEDAVGAGAYNDPVAPGSASDLAEARELIEFLEKAVEKLPPVQQLLVTLYHRQELSYAEIMTITGLPEGTIKSFLYRARHQLKTSLLVNYNPADL